MASSSAFQRDESTPAFAKQETTKSEVRAWEKQSTKRVGARKGKGKKEAEWGVEHTEDATRTAKTKNLNKNNEHGAWGAPTTVVQKQKAESKLRNSLHWDKHDPNKWACSFSLKANLEKLLVGAKYRDDFYPIEFNPETGVGDVFKRTKLTEFCIVNPPFAEVGKGRFERPLSEHIDFLTKLSKKELVPIAILVPVRRERKWFLEAEEDPLIRMIFFTERFSFLKGIKLKEAGKAPMLNMLLVVGAGTENMTVNNEGEKWIFPKRFKPHPSFSRFSQGKLEEEVHDFKQKFQENVMSRQKNFKKADGKQVNPMTFQKDVCLRRGDVSTLLGHAKLSQLISSKVVCKKIRRKQREMLSVTHVTELLEEHGENFKFWKQGDTLKCKCGAFSHTPGTCPHKVNPKKSLGFLDPEDSRLYDFLTKVSKRSLPSKKRTWSLEELERELVRRAHLKDWFKKKFAEISQIGVPEQGFEFNTNTSKIHWWWAWGCDTRELIDLAFGTRVRWIQEPPRVEIRNYAPQEDWVTISREIKRSVELGQLWAVPDSFAHVILPQFIVKQEKEGGVIKERLILDARFVNFFTPCDSFSLPTPTEAAANVSRYLFTIDMKDAYKQKKLAFVHRKYFCIRDPTDQRVYTYTSLPFGLGPAPFEFSRFSGIIARIILCWTLVYVYLDDFLIEIPEQFDNEFLRNGFIKFILKVFNSLGLRINAKCVTRPSTEIDWLGMSINSQLNSTFPLQYKVFRCVEDFAVMLQEGEVTLRALAGLHGKLRYITSTWGKFYYSKITRFLSEHLDLDFAVLDKKTLYRKQFDKKVEFPSAKFINTFHEILFLLLELAKPGRRPGAKQVAIFSDAGEVGGGFWWASDEKKQRLLEVNWDKLESILVPEELQVDQDKHPSVNPSLILREIFVVKKAVTHFLNHHPTFDGDITCTLDNIGAVCSLLSGRCKCDRTAELIAEILEFSKPEGPVLYFNWNRRNEPGIEPCDFASKNYPIELTRLGWERIRANFPGLLKEVTFEMLFFPFSTFETIKIRTVARRNPMREDKMSVIICHPEISKNQASMVQLMLKNERFRGIVLIPRRVETAFGRRNFQKFLTRSRKYFNSPFENFFGTCGAYKTLFIDFSQN